MGDATVRNHATRGMSVFGDSRGQPTTVPLRPVAGGSPGFAALGGGLVTSSPPRAPLSNSLRLSMIDTRLMAGSLSQYSNEDMNEEPIENIDKVSRLDRSVTEDFNVEKKNNGIPNSPLLQLMSEVKTEMHEKKQNTDPNEPSLVTLVLLRRNVNCLCLCLFCS